jgi:tyrosyl-tRNA synthetase
MGGSDQWGNIVTGTELIRKKGGSEAFAFTCPLITKSDGGKFGKTEKGNIWLDAKKTSPYQFYQFWLNAADADAEKYIKIFTFLEQPEIEELVAAQKGNEHLRLLQKRLAEELTCFVHNREAYEFAVKASSILFSNETADILQQLNEEQLLQVMEGVPTIKVSKEKIAEGTDIITFLSESGIFPSKGEARKMLQGGGISINKNKIDATELLLKDIELLNDKYFLIQKGKRNYYLVIAD